MLDGCAMASILRKIQACSQVYVHKSFHLLDTQRDKLFKLINDIFVILGLKSFLFELDASQMGETCI